MKVADVYNAMAVKTGCYRNAVSFIPYLAT